MFEKSEYHAIKHNEGIITAVDQEFCEGVIMKTQETRIDLHEEVVKEALYAEGWVEATSIQEAMTDFATNILYQVLENVESIDGLYTDEFVVDKILSIIQEQITELDTNPVTGL